LTFKSSIILFYFQNTQPNARIQQKIKSIQIVYNKALEDAFESKKVEFSSKGIPIHEVMAFHGTPKANIPGILKTNLQYLVSSVREN
jgi:hypothetical protein